MCSTNARKWLNTEGYQDRVFNFDISKFYLAHNNDLRTLHDQFYEKDFYSTDISSHWVILEKSQDVRWDGFSIQVFGHRFGDYRIRQRSPLIKHIIDFPIDFTAWLLLFTLPKTIREAVRLVSIDTGRRINHDFIRLAKSLVNIMKACPNLEKMKRVMVVGDGFGTFGCLISHLFPSLVVIQVNLGKQLFLICYLALKPTLPRAIN